MSWREAQLTFVLAAVLTVAGAGVLVGCRHAERDTVPSQPFRTEREPSDGFQYSEGAVPSGEAGDKADEGASSESSVEVDVEGNDPGASAASDDDDGDDDEGDGDDGSGGGKHGGRGGDPGGGDPGGGDPHDPGGGEPGGGDPGGDDPGGEGGDDPASPFAF